jgi:hypothetical protein
LCNYEGGSVPQKFLKSLLYLMFSFTSTLEVESSKISIRGLAEKVKKITKSSSPIVFIPYEQAYEKGFEDMHRRVPDITTSQIQMPRRAQARDLQRFTNVRWRAFGEVNGTEQSTIRVSLGPYRELPCALHLRFGLAHEHHQAVTCRAPGPFSTAETSPRCSILFLSGRAEQMPPPSRLIHFLHAFTT